MISACFSPNSPDVLACCASIQRLSTAVVNPSDCPVSLYHLIANPPFVRHIKIHPEKTPCLLSAMQDSESNLIALVPALSPPVLIRILNTSTHTLVIELFFPFPIRAIRMNLNRLVVLMDSLVEILHVPTFRRIKSLHEKFGPRRSPSTYCCALSSNGILAFASTQTNRENEGGSVSLWDCNTLQPLCSFASIHTHALACLCLSSNGELLATASESGTLIRISSVSNQQANVYCVRRGFSNAQVLCMSFSEMRFENHMFICVASDSGTVHVFQLPLAVLSTRTSLFIPPTWLIPQALVPYSLESSSPLLKRIGLMNVDAIPLACSFVDETTPRPEMVMVRVVTNAGLFWELTFQCEGTDQPTVSKRFNLLGLDNDADDEE